METMIRYCSKMFLGRYTYFERSLEMMFLFKCFSGWYVLYVWYDRSVRGDVGTQVEVPY